MGKWSNEYNRPVGRHDSDSSNGSLQTQLTVTEDQLTGHCQEGANGHRIPMRLKKNRSQSNHTRETPNEPQHPVLSGASGMPPTEHRSMSSLANYRKVLATIDSMSPSASQPIFTTSHNTHNANSTPPDRVASLTPSQSLYQAAFLNDSAHLEGSPMFPTYRPGTSRTAISDAPDSGYDADHRRPSIASATTVSSQGSKSSTSGKFRKRLQGFFGEEYPDGLDSRHDSDTGYHHRTSRDNSAARERNNSTNSRNVAERPTESAPSPIPSRPRTPVPSSDVTPWMYQSFNDIPQFGDAPVREIPTEPDGSRVLGNIGVSSMALSSLKDSHKSYFTGHRHSRSREEKPTSSGSGDSTFYHSRPVAGGDDFSIGLRIRDGVLNAPTAMSSTTTLGARSISPSPSMQGTFYRDSGGQQFQHVSDKRSLFDKFLRHKTPSAFKHLPGSSKTMHDPFKASSKIARREISPSRRSRQSSFDGVSIGKYAESDFERKKESGKGFGIGSTKFRGRRGFSSEISSGKDTRGQHEREPIWNLDTDLEHMEGIISEPRPLSPTDNGGIFDGDPPQMERTKGMLDYSTGRWSAPDSWRVKKHGDDLVKALPEIDNGPDSIICDDGTSYFIRVFRIDSTFATLAAGRNATVADILSMLGRKSFLQDDLNNYEIVMRKNDVSRQLEHGERPVLIQKRLLEQVGYTTADRIEDVGREDHSYLCRFVFLPAKLSGYASLENDPGLNKSQKLTHVDLQGRNLLTIPIILYKRASEIISLNLSRNLSLDIPSDFIQSCINLRDIKFMSNEAWRPPYSISLASRLSYLDMSNNRIELLDWPLDWPKLERLQGLVSIKLANNKLSRLPEYFGRFQSLRSLNLSSNNFQVFPDCLCGLPSLIELDISFNGIRSLPNIGRIATLKQLWVTNNMLAGSLDESFKDLINLREIDARFNSITNVDSIVDIPRLDQLSLGHNKITKFDCCFPKLRALSLDHCPITEFNMYGPVPTLTSLNIASAKLVQFKDSLFDFLPNVTKLVLNRNQFTSFSMHIGKLRKLEHFSMMGNPLGSLPHTIGYLSELKYLNLRECNLDRLPSEIWYCLKLETLNVSSNVLTSFPKLTGHPPQLSGEWVTNNTPYSTPPVSSSPSYENLGVLEDMSLRRPSQASGGHLSIGSSQGSYRNNSVVSTFTQGGRKPSVASRSFTDGQVTSRKDSNFSQRVANTLAASLRNLYLADNQLEDDVFREISLLSELRVLNLSYNSLTEMPQGFLKRLKSLSELYLSGNMLTSLPSDDLEEGSALKTLHINANRFQVLPAELCKISKLAVLDVGSNSLKYNVSNWPYDWNWNWNRRLKYLNFSGNKRLEIKPNVSSVGHPMVGNGTDLTDFSSLSHLRVLGLMDVTLTIKTIPEETEDRRVRTSASFAGSLAYGMADFLGRNEHLSIIDMMVPRLRADNVDTLVGLFDGQSQSIGGSKVAKFLHENFTTMFVEELKRLHPDTEAPLDALRRTFLGLNKDMAAAAYKSIDDREHRQHSRMSAAAKLFNEDDIQSGGVATVLYLKNMDLYVGNVGDAQAILVGPDAIPRFLTRRHDPTEPDERARIRRAGGFVSRNGKLNDILTISRAFGYFQSMPSVIAAPHTAHFKLTEQDEMIIMASKEVWEFLPPPLIVDVARSERSDLMIAAQKIRDLAIAFGATNKLMVMILGVSDLKKRERLKIRGATLSMGPSSFPEDQQIVPSTKRTRKPRDGPGDSRLARFDYVDAPTGELAVGFTDIKKSTALWEACPNAMRSAIQIHNDILRRQLGIVGGYEVKTEGDAFMVAFSTATAALLWCFNCQTQLLEAEWPTEVLQQPQCKESYDSDQNMVFRGLSVRIGIHWGDPVCEKDPVTNRMDYFGPMVNRASRISAVADGGEIFVSSDFMSELRRMHEVFADSERSASIDSTSEFTTADPFQNVRRELQQLNSLGFIIKDQGERKLKGLENPEQVFQICPHSLAGRLVNPGNTGAEDEKAPIMTARHSQLGIDTDLIWRLGKTGLRLESLCNYLENPGENRLRRLFNVLSKREVELTDSAIVGLVEQVVTRIEICINTLCVRHLMHPFRPGDKLKDHVMPMSDVIQQLQTQLAEFAALKQRLNTGSIELPELTVSLTADGLA